MSVGPSIARVAAVCVKEVMQMRRDRLTFAMVVMIPLMQLLMFGYSINTKIRNIPIAVCDHAGSSFSRQLVQDVQASQVVLVEQHVNDPGSLERMAGKLVPYVAIGLLQMTIILWLGSLLFQVPVAGSWLLLVGCCLLFIFANLALGLLLSTIARTQMGAIQLFIFLFLPSILLSGFMFPYQGMPEPARWLAEILPMTHFMRIVRGVVLRDAGAAGLATDLAYLGGFFAVALLLAIVRFKKRLD